MKCLILMCYYIQYGIEANFTFYCCYKNNSPYFQPELGVDTANNNKGITTHKKDDLNLEIIFENTTGFSKI